MGKKAFLIKVFLINLSVIVFFLADRWFKYFIPIKLPSRGVYLIEGGGGLGFKFLANKFIAFNLPLPLPWALFASFIILFLVLIYLVKFYREANLSLIFILTLIFGGAVSNLADRLYYSYVIDYVNIFILPTFNIADIMIFVGTIIFIVKYYKYEIR